MAVRKKRAVAENPESVIAPIMLDASARLQVELMHLPSYCSHLSFD